MLIEFYSTIKNCCRRFYTTFLGWNSIFNCKLIFIFFILSYSSLGQTTLQGQINFSSIQCVGGFSVITFSANGGFPPYVYSLDGVNFSSDNVFQNCSPGQYAQLKIRDQVLNEISLPAIVIMAGTQPLSIVWQDADGDGYGNNTVSLHVCNTVPYGFSLQSGDCNDQDLYVFPGAIESCNQLDDDCDGSIDNTLNLVAYFEDSDGDGYGTGNSLLLCYDPGFGFASLSGDCNDQDDQVNPGQLELCNAIDDDCNAQVDDGLVYSVYHIDNDLDGFGGTQTVWLCNDPGVGFATSNQDCNDENPLVNPSASEICNEIDDNCNSLVDTYDPILSPAGPLQMNLTADLLDCFGGVTDILPSVAGGNAPYSFMNQNLINVNAGEYVIYVYDAEGCSAEATISIVQPAELQVVSTVPPISCFGGQTICTIAGSGGSPPYAGTGNFLRSAGNHPFVITDANGCTVSTTIAIQQPDSLYVSFANTSIGCFGESVSIQVSAAGGIGPFNGVGQFSQQAGTAVYTISDANGCSASKTLTLQQPDQLNIYFTYTPISVAGGSASVQVQASGGSPPYSGTGTFSQPAGDMSYTVTDANGCIVSENLTLVQPGALFATVVEGTIPCFGDSALLEINASGGTPPYFNTAPAKYPAGPYSIVISDAAGATFTVSGVLSQPDPIQITSAVSPIACIGGASPVIIAANGGVSPFVGVGNFLKTAGNWDFIVTDTNGCMDTISVSLNDPPPAQIAVEVLTPVLCYGGTALVNIGPAVAGQVFIGSGIFSFPAGQQTINLMDLNGCAFSQIVNVTQPDSIIITSSIVPVQCYGVAQGSIQLQGAGGTAPLNFVWSNGQTSAVLASLPSGNYSVLVTDANGCSVTRQYSITQPSPLPDLGLVNGILQSCKPYGAGSETISVSPISDGLNITTYNWSLPSGLTILSGQGTPQITIGWTAAALDATISGFIHLQAYNICTARSVTSPISYALVPPVTPPSISGNPRLCPGDSFVYSVSNVARASGYNWILPTGLLLTSANSGNVITGLALPTFNGGTVTVSASNVCGTGGLRTRLLSKRSATTPAAISGLSTGLCGVNTVMYSISPVTGVDGYQWNIPAGAQIVNGQGSTQVNVEWNNTPGALSVSTFNTCGSSSERTMMVSMIPARPGVITGSISPCFNTSQPYSISTVSGTNSYQWIATGNPVIAGQGTKNATLYWQAGIVPAQFLSVRAVNNCGISTTRSMNISLLSCNRLDDLQTENKLGVWPNPASDMLNFNWTMPNDEDMKMLIYDAGGRILVMDLIPSVIGDNYFELNIAGLQSGVYRIVLVGSNNFFSANFIRI